MLKVARIFQLFKLSYVVQVLVNTLKASSSELCVLLVIMGFVMVVFASFVYFLERREFNSDFKSVPDSMWWAVITMTTVSIHSVKSAMIMHRWPYSIHSVKSALIMPSWPYSIHSVKSAFIIHSSPYSFQS